LTHDAWNVPVVATGEAVIGKEATGETEMIQFTSIVPRWFGGTSLSLVVLKSYLLHKWPDMQISMNTSFSDDDAKVIVEKIMSAKHRVFGFSVYMWNLKTVLNVC